MTTSSSDSHSPSNYQDRTSDETATVAHITEGGAIGAVGAAVVGALAAGPAGAVTGAIIGAAASAAAINVLDRESKDCSNDDEAAPVSVQQ